MPCHDIDMPPDALLFLSSHCPHCPAVLAGLSELVKRGSIGRLEVINLEQHPEAPAALQVRTVPWLRLGPYILTGARTLGELETWARRCVGEEITSSPGLKRVTREPTATTSPEASRPVICGRR